MGSEHFPATTGGPDFVSVCAADGQPWPCDKAPGGAKPIDALTAAGVDPRDPAGVQRVAAAQAAAVSEATPAKPKRTPAEKAEKAARKAAKAAAATPSDEPATVSPTARQATSVKPAAVEATP